MIHSRRPLLTITLFAALLHLLLLALIGPVGLKVEVSMIISFLTLLVVNGVWELVSLVRFSGVFHRSAFSDERRLCARREYCRQTQKRVNETLEVLARSWWDAGCSVDRGSYETKTREWKRKFWQAHLLARMFNYRTLPIWKMYLEARLVGRV
ncbi:hypothetical protein KKG41_02135 [Patescibacteria group bacterium]|nr:hypothetical protein [Patescibacteria group bacterium]